LPGLGVIFAGVGVALLFFFAPLLNQEAERVETLPSLSAAAVAAGPPGREGLLEGRISERNPTYFRSFVAYVRYEYRGQDKDGADQWVEDERVTPALWLDVPGGRVQLENNTYSLQGDLIRWQAEPLLRWDSFSQEGTKSYRGIERGNSVLAVGTVVEGAAGHLFRAELLYRGTRTSYSEGQRSSARLVGWLGGAFSLIGLILLGLGGWLWLRRGN
jgi:hypothetical protein